MKIVKYVFVFVVLSFYFKAFSQENEVKTGFVLTNQKLPRTNLDTLYYQYVFPKKYINLFFEKSDTAEVLFEYSNPKSTNIKYITKSAVTQVYRSPLYCIFIPLTSLNDDTISISPHKIQIVSKNKSYFTNDKISKKDIDKPGLEVALPGYINPNNPVEESYVAKENNSQ